MGRGRVSEADPLRRRGAHHRAKKPDTGNTSGRTGFDGFPSAPWRKTVSIFKQPVTLVHTTRSRDNKKPTPDQLKRGANGRQQKPVQMLWSKALEGVEAVVPVQVADKASIGGEALSSQLELAQRLTPAATIVSSQAATASLCSSLHNPLGAGQVVGQASDAKVIDANPKMSIDSDQPLISAVNLVEDDVKTQERRVIDARKRLQEIRKSFFS